MGIGKNRWAEGKKSEQMALLRKSKCHELTRACGQGVFRERDGAREKASEPHSPYLWRISRYGWMWLSGSKQLERKNVRVMVTQE